MHVLFLAPDTHAYNHLFLRGLKSVGARISAIGLAPQAELSAAVRPLLDDYRACPRMAEPAHLLATAREMEAGGYDRIETIDEPLVDLAAQLRGSLGVAGLSLETALLARDKVRMKEFLREHDIPCANSAAVGSAAELRAFAEREGYPLIVKPIAGFGSLDTHRIDDRAALEALVPRLRFEQGRRVAVEEFVDGHEGFFDTIVGPDGVRHEFAAHYFPGCLEATVDRRVSPQIAVTNRLDDAPYRELREMGAKVVEALGLHSCATHMEWFFGSKGLKFSEIGARPAGEKIWDMYRVAGEFDVFREWALAVTGQASEASPSRRLCAGSIQIRPDRDGRVLRHVGTEEAFQRLSGHIYEHELPAPGSPTKGIERGWICNTWFRLYHEDFDALCRSMSYLARTVKTEAR